MAASTVLQRPVAAPIYLPSSHAGVRRVSTFRTLKCRLATGATALNFYYFNSVAPAESAVAADAVIISFVSESSDANGVRTVDVVRALQSDTIQDVKLRLRTRGHRVSNGHALVRRHI